MLYCSYLKTTAANLAQSQRAKAFFSSQTALYKYSICIKIETIPKLRFAQICASSEQREPGRLIVEIDQHTANTCLLHNLTFHDMKDRALEGLLKDSSFGLLAGVST